VLKEKSGFWLVHSVPKFPPALGEDGEDEIYDYPHSGKYIKTFIEHILFCKHAWRLELMRRLEEI
jgi:hypothetical protein